MAWFDSGYLDDYGMPIMVDESGNVQGEEIYGSTEAPVIIDPNDARYQDYGPPGPGYSYLVAPGKPTAQYVDTAPEIIAAAGSILKAAMPVVDAAGRYYQYKKTNVNGQQVYQRTAYTGATGLFGLSPAMLFAIAAVGFIALGDKK